MDCTSLPAQYFSVHSCALRSLWMASGQLHVPRLINGTCCFIIYCFWIPISLFCPWVTEKKPRFWSTAYGMPTAIGILEPGESFEAQNLTSSSLKGSFFKGAYRGSDSFGGTTRVPFGVYLDPSSV